MKRKHIYILFASLFILSSLFPLSAQAGIADNWRWQNPMPQGNTIRSIAYGKNRYIAAGDAGTILTSIDSVTWTLQKSALTTASYGIAFGNGVFVAVGEGGRIYTSADGTEWKKQTSATENDLYDITFNDNTFVAVGGSETILTSPDGVQWERNDISGTTTNRLMSICYGNGTFIAVGDAGMVLTSTDGSAWLERERLFSTYNLERIACSNSGEYVIVGNSGDDGVLLTSQGRLRWSERYRLTGEQLKGIAYGNGTYIAFGINGTFLFSQDGIAWTSNTDKYYWTVFSGGTYLNGIYLAFGEGGSILHSPDGQNWEEQSSGYIEDLYGIVYGNGRYVAAASYGYVFTSPDGSTWASANTGTSAYHSGITYGKNLFVTVGGGGDVRTSPNGTDWTERTSPGVNDLHAAAFGAGAGTFVAVGTYGKVITSPDGITWTSVTSNTDRDLWGIAYGNGRFVAVGLNGTILTSPTGAVWTKLNTAPTVEHLYGIGYCGDRFIAVGSGGTILTSPTGLAPWTSQESNALSVITGITYGNGAFVAVGEGGLILVSRDGEKWVKRTSGTNRYLQSIMYNSTNNTFITVGYWGTILESGDVSLPLNVAVNNPALTFTTGGYAGWFGETSVSYLGASAVQSGFIGHGQNSWIETTITGPALVSFYWKVSSELGYDYLKFFVDGVERDTISGEEDWRNSGWIFEPGNYTLRWLYETDTDLTSGSDSGWLDKVEITTTKPTLNITTSGSGTVIVDPLGTSCGSNCLEYTWYDTVTLMAIADAGSTFTGWSGACTGSSPTCTLVMDVAKPVTATFSSLQALIGDAVDNPSLNWSTGGNAGWFRQTDVYYAGGSAIQSDAIGNSQNSDVQTTVNVTGPAQVSFYWNVSSEAGYDYLRFYIDGVEQDKISGVTLDWQHMRYILPAGRHTLTWSYTKDDSYSDGSDCGWLDKVEIITTKPTLAITTSGPGTVDISPSGKTCGSNCREYDWNAIVTLTATEQTDSLFKGWSGDCTGSDWTCTVTMDGTKAVTATFYAFLILQGDAADSPSLNLLTGGDGNWFTQANVFKYGDSAFQTGAVGNSQNAWIGRSITGPARLSFYWKVSSEPDYDFLYLYIDGEQKDKISGEVDWQRKTYFLPSGDHYVIFIYEKDETFSSGSDCGWLDKVEITQSNPILTVAISGQGTVTSLPSGINCGTDCTEAYNVDTSVALQATPQAGSTFTGWSGDCTGVSSCTVTMDTDRTVTATFALANAGIGVAVDNPIQNNRPLIWSTGGDQGWFVSNSHFFFGGSAIQSGAIADNQKSDVQTTVTGPAQVSFYWKVSSESDYDYLRFYIDGVEQDKISGNMLGWQQKSYSLPEGNHSLTWSYTKDENYSSDFDCGWLDRVEIIVPLNLTLKTMGSGLVIKSTTGLEPSFEIDCGDNCYSYPSGTALLLTAIPRSGSIFTRWSGDCQGATPTCPIVMDAAKSVTASFTQQSMGETLDNPLLLLTTGPNVWFSQALTANSGGSALQSGPILDTEVSWVETTITGPTQLSFFWKVSSELNYDFLRFSINGVEQEKISGEVDWQQKTYNIPAGAHTLRWEYAKDFMLSEGSDRGWLDTVAVTPRYTLTVTKTGNGTGVITSSPEGINCGATCMKTYQTGTQVILTAYQDTGSLFNGWTGVNCTGKGACTVTIDRDVSLAGNFTSDAVPTSPDPKLITKTTAVNTWSKNNTVGVTWAPGTSAGSGVKGYSFTWDTNPTATPDNITETAVTSDGGLHFTTTSPALQEGNNYFHLRTVDNNGNASPVIHVGPFRIDTKAPALEITAPPSGAIVSSLSVIEGTATDPSPSSGFKLVQLQVKDESLGKYLDATGHWTNTLTWLNPSETRDDQITGKTQVAWRHQTQCGEWHGGAYTIIVRAADQADNIVTKIISITFASSSQVNTEIHLDGLADQSVLFNSKLTLTGTLSRLPNERVDLSKLPVRVTITETNGVVLQTKNGYTNDPYGNFKIETDALNKEGEFSIQASFAGNDFLKGSNSNQQIFSVGDYPGYAILIEGKIESGEGLLSHNKTTNRIYGYLRERGFAEENIRYFNYDTTQTLTYNETIVYALPTKTEIQNSITGWAKDRMNAKPGHLYIIMVDHGGPNGFYLGTEQITPDDLKSWLATLEAPNGLSGAAKAKKRIVIIGACYSGNFMQPLSGDGRIIITSAAENEQSFRGPLEPDNIRNGEYFMEALFLQLRKGLNLRDSFEEAARETREYTRSGGTAANAPNPYLDNAIQHPLIDDNGDGQGSNIFPPAENGDGHVADKVSLGNSGITPSGDNPVTVRIDHTKTFVIGWDKGNSAELWLTTSLDSYDIYLPWIEIRNPSITLTGDQWKNENILQKIRMEWDNNKSRYRILYNGFTESGRYEVFYYVPSKTGKVYSGGRSIVYKNKKDNNPPNAFQLRLPDKGSEQKTVLVMKWDGTTDPDKDPVTTKPDPLTYNLVIAEDLDFRREVYRQEELTVPMTFIDGSVILADGNKGLQDGKTYYWKIEAVDCYGNIRTSEVWSFTTKNTNVPPGIITGIVYSDRAMAFINQATVKAMIGNQVVASATSEQNGFFALEVNAGQVDQVIIEKTGFQPASINNVTVTTDETARVNPNIIPLSGTKGDINGDTQVTLADALIVLQVVTSKVPLPPSVTITINANTDVNGDGRINMTEAIYILQKIAELR